MLYKYFSPNAVNFAFSKNGISIRESQASSLNDPFELNYSKEDLIDFIEEVERRTTIESKNITQDSTLTILEDLLREVRKNHHQTIEELHLDKNDKNFGIISLSRNKNSRPMWAYYSMDHTGFMVALKTKKSSSSRSIGDIMFFNVDYSNIRPVLDRKHIHNPIFSDLIKKDIAWKHENESRAIVDISKKKSLETDSKGFPILCHTFDCEIISYIVLGARSNEALKRKIRNWIQTFSPKTKLYIAVPSKTHYKLEYEELTT